MWTGRRIRRVWLVSVKLVPGAYLWLVGQKATVFLLLFRLEILARYKCHDAGAPEHLGPVITGLTSF